MKVTITPTGEADAPVSEMILGQNIEMCLTTAHGLLSERLRNPKFVGPPHRMTGLAPEWQGASCGRGFYELTPGGGLLGTEAQLISSPAPNWNPQLHQNRVPVRAGELLELELWARAWHHPVKLRVELRPLASRAKAYDGGEIVVDKSWYARYTLALQVPRDDDEARLVVTLPEGGELWIDQLHLRPQGQPLLCREIVDEMARMRIPTLRFPGGIVVNAYNWRHGTGPAHLRPTMLEAAFHQNWELNYDFGLDEYLDICREQGITPAITLNVATGTPDDAGEIAAYVAAYYQRAGAEPPLVYWHVANHPYAPTTAHMTPAMYADVLQTFVPAVKARYPRSRVIGVMSAAGLTAEHDDWKEALFANAALIDVVQVQLYGGCDPNDAPDVQLQTVTETLVNFEGQMRAFLAEIKRRGADWTLGVAEWNWWLQASHWDGRAFEEPPTVLHGLFIAGMFHRYAALAPGFEVAHFYNLVNCMGILNHRGADVEITDAVEIFKLYRSALPGRLVPLRVVADADPHLDVLCLEDDHARWLFLVNRALADPAHVTLAGFPHHAAETTCLQGDSPIGAFTRREITGIADGAIEVPSMSIVRLKLPKEG